MLLNNISSEPIEIKRLVMGTRNFQEPETKTGSINAACFLEFRITDSLKRNQLLLEQ
jgi:hypothetical protein